MLKIIISPAKKMNEDRDSLECSGFPHFIERAEEIRRELCAKSYTELKKLWACNDSIAQLNYSRLERMNLSRAATPAILCYDGIRFKYMAPAVFDVFQFDYIQNHLFILSGFYGALRPFDAVVPYRLEMQAKLKINGCNNLYEYWKDDIYKYVAEGCDTIVNLASDEYSKAVAPFVSEDINYVTVIFADFINGKLIEKGTKCKMARGEMVRFMAENNIENTEDIKKFNRLNYRYSEKYSSENNIVFIQQKP